MATDVMMPQMGESIFEGTVTKWLKKIGETVERDEPLFEVSTDKVDAEIPSPAKGTLREIKAEAGATVQVNTIVAVIGEADTVQLRPKTPFGAETDSVSTQPNGTDDTTQPNRTDSPGGSTTEVVMPQMGESIFEGTITKWLKQVGDKIERDEPLFEISTDKVDAEIPSPVAGILQEVRAKAGITVQVNAIVALISMFSASDAVVHSAKAELSSSMIKSLTTSVLIPAVESTTVQSDEKLRSSPLVRKMAKKHNLDLRQISGSGSSGRITKENILDYINKASTPFSPEIAQGVIPSEAPVTSYSDNLSVGNLTSRVVPMTRMRSIIAQRMVESKHTNAHVHTVFKVDMTKIVRLREKEKAKYEQRNGVKLTYMPFIARAITATLQKMPAINASIEGDTIRYHSNVNLGIAVALEWGLVVPVIKQAEERSFLGVARAIADLAERARGKKLKPDEVRSSTFTLTNAGIYGEQFGTPIINMPESAILGIGGLSKEPTVITDNFGADSIAIRSIIHLTLGFDHRIIDGSDAGKFMSEVKRYLEGWCEDIA